MKNVALEGLNGPIEGNISMKMKKRLKKINILTGIISLFLLSSSLIYANYSSITGVTINPPNPALGQSFNVSIQMCLDEYDTPNELVVAASTSNVFQNPGTNGQVFLLSSLGIDVHSSNPGNAG